MKYRKKGLTNAVISGFFVIYISMIHRLVDYVQEIKSPEVRKIGVFDNNPRPTLPSVLFLSGFCFILLLFYCTNKIQPVHWT